MTRLRNSLQVAAFALLSSVALGDSHSDFYEKFNRQNFSGWKGIVFVCAYDREDRVLAEICLRGTSEIELLAVAAKVSLKVAEPNNLEQASFMAALNKFVTLEYELMATKTINSYDPKAVHGRLVFEVFYSNAVESQASSESLDRFPRSGDLELWSRPIIASGATSELVGPFAEAAESLFKKAIAHFLRYRNDA